MSTEHPALIAAARRKGRLVATGPGGRWYNRRVIWSAYKVGDRVEVWFRYDSHERVALIPGGSGRWVRARVQAVVAENESLYVRPDGWRQGWIVARSDLVRTVPVMDARGQSP